MNSDLPKILHRLRGQTAIHYLLSTTAGLNPDTLQLVVRYQAQQVIDAVRPDFPQVQFVRQSAIPGTAEAVRAAVEALPSLEPGPAPAASGAAANDPAVVLVLAGDAPLVPRSLLKWLLDQHCRHASQVSLISTEFADPTGYGRIVRDRHRDLLAIVEQNDATPDQLAIREVNTSVYAFDLAFLRENLARIDDHNTKGEFYLTDLIALADAKQAYLYADSTVLESFNTRAELAKIEERLAQTEGSDA
jgi:bifunctional UDP-N-acetylglucosamine pyrophosphorylase/glucosamine-1-phosphate N-acetyltransferase